MSVAGTTLPAVTNSQEPVPADTTDPSAVDGEFVERLTPNMTGRWLVTTRHTTHVWDLNGAATYERRPGAAGQAMPYDGQPVAIDRVERWPVVGDRALVFFTDPARPDWEVYRMCSAIVSIRRLTGDVELAAPDET